MEEVQQKKQREKQRLTSKEDVIAQHDSAA